MTPILLPALVHESERRGGSPTPWLSGSDRIGRRATQFCHPIQDVAGEQRLVNAGPLRA